MFGADEFLNGRKTGKWYQTIYQWYQTIYQWYQTIYQWYQTVPSLSLNCEQIALENVGEKQPKYWVA